MPVHNSSGTLDLVIPSVQCELGPEDRLLAVDDRSSDDSRSVLERLGVQTAASTGKPGAAGTRNTGGMAALTDWILFLDSDAVPEPGWRNRLGAEMEKSDAVQAVYGPEAPGKGAATFYKNYYYHHTFTRRIRGPYIKGCGTFFFAVRARVFRELGGFDENIAGATIEDADFSERLWTHGGRILIAPAIRVYHLREYTLTEFFRYEWNMMRAKALYILRRNPERGAPSISVAGFSEMFPVLGGALFSWFAVVCGILWASGVNWAANWFFLCLVILAGLQLPLFFHMTRAGGFRGLRACLLVVPDLLLIAPASISAVFSAIRGRRY
ncbi:MAG: glycosyltransferase [Candidatus Fermentibacteraceae bacterium]